MKNDGQIEISTLNANRRADQWRESNLNENGGQIEIAMLIANRSADRWSGCNEEDASALRRHAGLPRGTTRDPKTTGVSQIVLQKSVSKIFLQKSTPTRIRQLMDHTSTVKNNAVGSVMDTPSRRASPRYNFFFLITLEPRFG